MGLPSPWIAPIYQYPLPQIRKPYDGSPFETNWFGQCLSKNWCWMWQNNFWNILLFNSKHWVFTGLNHVPWICYRNISCSLQAFTWTADTSDFITKKAVWKLKTPLNQINKNENQFIEKNENPKIISPHYDII